MPENNPMAYMLDPRLLQQQAQGISAANQLKALPQSAEYARALRQSEATLPESVGQGYAQTGPNFMNLIAMMADRSAGRKNLGALDSRSEILRQQAQTGTEAGLQAEQQAKQNEFMQRQQEFEADRAFQRERDLMSQDQIKGPFRTWVNDEGHKIGVSNTGEGAITTDGTPPPVGYYPNDRPPASRSSTYKMSPKQQTALEDIANNFSAMDFVKGSFKDDYGSEKGIPKVNSFKMWTAKNASIFTDENTEEAAEWWSNYHRAYEIPIRHDFFGSALTESEKRLWRAANITPDMEPHQIRESLRIQEALWRKMGANARAITLAKDPNSENYVTTLFPSEVFFVDESVEDEISRALKERGLVNSRRPEIGSRVRTQPNQEIREGEEAPNQEAAMREFQKMQQNIQRIEQQLQQEREALEGAEVR